MTDRFRVGLGRPWHAPWPEYFEKFYYHCQKIAQDNDWATDTVCNHELNPLGGRLIKNQHTGLVSTLGF